MLMFVKYHLLNLGNISPNNNVKNITESIPNKRASDPLSKYTNTTIKVSEI
jgi:hypothetical protein